MLAKYVPSAQTLTRIDEFKKAAQLSGLDLDIVQGGSEVWCEMHRQVYPEVELSPGDIDLYGVITKEEQVSLFQQDLTGWGRAVMSRFTQATQVPNGVQLGHYNFYDLVGDFTITPAKQPWVTLSNFQVGGKYEKREGDEARQLYPVYDPRIPGHEKDFNEYMTKGLIISYGINEAIKKYDSLNQHQMRSAAINLQLKVEVINPLAFMIKSYKKAFEAKKSISLATAIELNELMSHQYLWAKIVERILKHYTNNPEEQKDHKTFRDQSEVIRYLNDFRSRVQDVIRQAPAKVATLEQTVTEQVSEIEALRRALAESKAENARMADQHLAEKRALESKADAQTAEVTRLTSETHEAKQALEAQEQDNEKLSSELKTARAEIAVKNKELFTVKALKEQIEKLKKSSKGFEDQVKVARSAVETKSQEVVQLQENVSTGTEKNSDLSSKLAERSSTIDYLEAVVKKKDDEIASIQKLSKPILDRILSHSQFDTDDGLINLLLAIDTMIVKEWKPVPSPEERLEMIHMRVDLLASLHDSPSISRFKSSLNESAFRSNSLIMMARVDAVEKFLVDNYQDADKFSQHLSFHRGYSEFGNTEKEFGNQRFISSTGFTTAWALSEFIRKCRVAHERAKMDEIWAKDLEPILSTALKNKSKKGKGADLKDRSRAALKCLFKKLNDEFPSVDSDSLFAFHLACCSVRNLEPTHPLLSSLSVVLDEEFLHKLAESQGKAQNELAEFYIEQALDELAQHNLYLIDLKIICDPDALLTFLSGLIMKFLSLYATKISQKSHFSLDILVKTINQKKSEIFNRDISALVMRDRLYFGASDRKFDCKSAPYLFIKEIATMTRDERIALRAVSATIESSSSLMAFETGNCFAIFIETLEKDLPKLDMDSKEKIQPIMVYMIGKHVQFLCELEKVPYDPKVVESFFKLLRAVVSIKDSEFFSGMVSVNERLNRIVEKIGPLLKMYKENPLFHRELVTAYERTMRIARVFIKHEDTFRDPAPSQEQLIHFFRDYLYAAAFIPHVPANEIENAYLIAACAFDLGSAEELRAFTLKAQDANAFLKTIQMECIGSWIAAMMVFANTGQVEPIDRVFHEYRRVSPGHALTDYLALHFKFCDHMRNNNDFSQSKLNAFKYLEMVNYLFEKADLTKTTSQTAPRLINSAIQKMKRTRIFGISDQDMRSDYPLLCALNLLLSHLALSLIASQENHRAIIVLIDYVEMLAQQALQAIDEPEPVQTASTPSVATVKPVIFKLQDLRLSLTTEFNRLLALLLHKQGGLEQGDNFAIHYFRKAAQFPNLFASEELCKDAYINFIKDYFYSFRNTTKSRCGGRVFPMTYGLSGLLNADFLRRLVDSKMTLAKRNELIDQETNKSIEYYMEINLFSFPGGFKEDRGLHHMLLYVIVSAYHNEYASVSDIKNSEAEKAMLLTIRDRVKATHPETLRELKIKFA